MVVRGNKGYILLYCQINLLEEIKLSAGETDRKMQHIGTDYFKLLYS